MTAADDDAPGTTEPRLVNIDVPPRRSGPARPALDPPGTSRPRLPRWLAVKLPGGEGYNQLKSMVDELGLHTVCQEASCPNVGECWNERELTLMILGDTCTRSCGFCDVKTGKPPLLDEGEPRRVAEALGSLDLRHAVITSVDRDELPDGGAAIWAETIRRVKSACPDMSLEVLVPDFRGVLDHLDIVLDAQPEVLAHNIETVPAMQLRVRPQARYDWSLKVLAHAHSRGSVTKTGLMLGLGESREELLDVLGEIASTGVDILTLGQYLRPSPRHLPVDRFVSPEEFEELAAAGHAAGIRHVESGPLVRSSYRAGSQYRKMVGKA